MPITSLDHVNVRTTQLDTMVNWYIDVIGLRSGYRPEFSSTGAWMYAGDTAIVHLVLIDEQDAIGSETSLKLEHFALRGTGISEFKAKLRDHGERFECSEVPELSIVLLNLWDPDGNHIHIDFEMAD